MATLTPYPSDMSEAAGILLSKATGGDVSLARAIHAGWHLQGCGLNRLYPDSDAAVFSSAGGVPPDALPASVSDEDGQAALSAIAAPVHSAPMATVGEPLADLILRQALAYAMQLLQRWLNPVQPAI